MKTNTNKYWSEKFAANIKKSKPVDMYNLMTEVLEIEDNKVKILADFCVKMMLERDIKDFIRDPDSLKKILHYCHGSRRISKNYSRTERSGSLLEYL